MRVTREQAQRWMRAAKWLGCRSVSAWLDEPAEEQSKRLEHLARDPNELAFQVFKEAIGEAPPSAPEPQKNPAAVALGKLGGAKGGKARAATMTQEERAESARKAAQARWRRPTP